MTYAVDRADHVTIVGRVVGDNGRHIAVAHASRGDGTGMVLAVRRDGQEYTVWTTVPGPDGTVMTMGGRYFSAAEHGGSYGAYQAAQEFFKIAVGGSS